MNQLEQELSQAESACSTLVEAGKEQLTWSWDDRFGAALATFSAAQIPAVQELLAPAFADRLTSATLADAGAAAAEIAGAFGGLRGGQALYLSQYGAGVALVGAWWPWGGGDTISLRVKLVLAQGEQEQRDQAPARCRGWFGV